MAEKKEDKAETPAVKHETRAAPAGQTDVDAKAAQTREAAVEKTNEAARQADNTARRESEQARPPTSREVEELRKKHFGDKAGSVHLDVDPATGKTNIVYVDGDGNATKGGVFKPKKGD